ncbi:UDP-N-acetylmuramoyl-L-alanyl-D-glutamate--2,6-diaminopimelate ligase [candidate division KSB1 bacterium]|nr:UDP-N-acetylmuramoyl-L-alanyl-D-glutamate--2,6-diaminopimelate ligase [candidate division KSB1 bacterium]
MDLQKLLELLPEKRIAGEVKNIDVKGIVYDPLRVENDFVYVAINIYTQLDKVELPDGHPFVGDAIRKGATVVVVEQDVDIPPSIIKVVVPDSRLALGLLANAFYDHPSRKMKVVGVTGTNGKTTTTHIIESILIQDHKVGLVGTLYYKLNGEIRKSKDTTPEPPDLQEILRQMADRDFDYVTLEASSHGIDFHRLTGIDFDVAVFTNLTQDHLDYHKTMEAYLQTKLRLFQWLSPQKHAIVNVDDPAGEKFIAATRARVLTYALDRPADITAKNVRLTLQGTEYDLVTPKGSISVVSGLVGRHNLYNTLAAVGVAISQGIDLQRIKSGLERPIYVSGRFELVKKRQEFAVVVDYAHTPDGFENVLSLARKLEPSRVITVFGCGGDRDREKRPIMGRVAAQYSDVIYLTSDNPRNEEPGDIIKDIAAGIDQLPVQVETIIDRREAIRAAIENAGPNDIVMILGKGHETTQTIKDRTIEFNDRIEAEKALDFLFGS